MPVKARQRPLRLLLPPLLTRTETPWSLPSRVLPPAERSAFQAPALSPLPRLRNALFQRRPKRRSLILNADVFRFPYFLCNAVSIHCFVKRIQKIFYPSSICAPSSGTTAFTPR